MLIQTLRPLLLLLAFCTICTLTRAQDKNIPKEFYSASSLPDSLKTDANSVVRYQADEAVVTDPGKMTLKHHSIVTILNEKADNEASLTLYYNKKYDTYGSIALSVYDANGLPIKKYHKSDFYDGSASDDETMVTNERFMAQKHPIVSYPVTIEVEYEETLNSFISLDSWRIQDRVEQAVQNASYKISCNPSVGLRFKNSNTNIKPQKTESGGLETYTWTVKNLKAIKKEENVLLWNVLPRISFAVNTFNCYGYPGDFSNWQSFGKWIKGLNDDVCTLSPERVAQIKQMTDSIPTEKGKARFLYNYLQKNTRYVSIQLGIGGYKPFPASFVDEKKYGDCKALSNYMRALLKAVNINSYYTIIRAQTNDEPVDVNFPINRFNHAILCIPFKNDTTWLECTSITSPFGKLSPSTENRKALIVTEDGGKLINTPVSQAADNQFNSQAHLILDAEGTARAEIKISGTGIYRAEYIDMEAYKTDDQKQYYMRILNLKQPSLFSFGSTSDKNGIKEVNLNLEYERFYDIASGDKQFYRPRVVDIWQFTTLAEEKRKNDFYFDSPLMKTCVTTIDLPKGFEVETLPADQNLKFTYGNYEVIYKYDATKNQVISTAKFNLTNQVIPAAKYTEMQVYMDAVAKAQNKKLVIRRKA